jgi:hypothetical protein
MAWEGTCDEKAFMTGHVGRVVPKLRRPCAGYRVIATALRGLSRDWNGPASMSDLTDEHYDG